VDKNSSIVRVDKRGHRVIAQENWGLTKEQMKGKHVHHRIKRCDGGTNDPSNLYVCSEWFHDKVWHEEEGGFTGCASLGTERLHRVKDKDGKSVHAKRMCEARHRVRDERGKSVSGIEPMKKRHEVKNSSGKSVLATKAGQATAEVVSIPVLVWKKGEECRMCFKSGHEAARVLGIHQPLLCKVLNGHRKSTGGYYAEYSV